MSSSFLALGRRRIVILRSGKAQECLPFRPRLCAGERSEPLRDLRRIGHNARHVRLILRRRAGGCACHRGIGATGLHGGARQALVHDVAELLAAVDSVVFDDADFEATVRMYYNNYIHYMNYKDLKQ